MKTVCKAGVLTMSLIIAADGGCAAPNVDLSALSRPDRSAKLDDYNVFVGSWTWEAELLNATGPDKNWTGTAKWEWTLDKRCLHGLISAESANAKYDAAGVWSWHPRKNKYIWWMFNDWGYPQQGTANYDEDSKTWVMKYKSVGLDGTASRGEYRLEVIDRNTIKWCNIEWAGPCHIGKKLEMRGTYKRRS